MYQQRRDERNGVRQPQRDNRTNRGPKQAKGHDAILKDLQDRKCTVVIVPVNQGSPLVGSIMARDKFTITITDKEGIGVTIYKHAVAAFFEASEEMKKQLAQ